MSFFYLSPVKGTIPFHVLEIIVTKRLEHLNAIFRNATIDYNEYVIEGSIYDNIGHYTLCMAAILEQNNDLNNFILQTEIALFRLRLKELSTAYEIRCFTKKLLKNIRKLHVSMSFLKPLQVLCQHIYLRHISQHLSCECNNDCTSYSIELKFIHCLDFISRRQIGLTNGIGKIPCNKWREYLIILFSANLKHKLSLTKLEYVTCDPRINEIVAKVRNKMSTGKLFTPNILSSQEVDGASVYFPPCMLNLHLQLRKRHRLSHEQRFNYSLFLKDVGMPINDAVEFWKSEYCKVPNAHSCCHNWAKDEKKFMYGIRHMYGLEGARNHYSCRNCNQIQNIENSCSEGGCPFKSFGDKQMLQLLELNENDALLSQINELKNKNQYSKACLLYLEKKVKGFVDCDKVCLNLTPVKYFMFASGK